MDILATISEAWGWKGIEPIAVIDTNSFGNLIVKTTSGHFWRICPEELSATRLADNEGDLAKVRYDPEFVADWDMALLAQQAADLLGSPGEGRCYGLKLAGVLGGKVRLIIK